MCFGCLGGASCPTLLVQYGLSCCLRTYLSDTPSLPNMVDFRGFDSSIILIQRGGTPRLIGDFPESLSQAMLVGVMLIGRLDVRSIHSSRVFIFIVLYLLLFLSLLVAVPYCYCYYENMSLLACFQSFGDSSNPGPTGGGSRGFQGLGLAILLGIGGFKGFKGLV